MGLKDHLEDGTGHILCLGLDLDYLHVEGAERQAGPSAAANRGVVQIRAGPAGGAGSSSSSSNSSGINSSGNSSYSSSSSNFSEESIISDSEDERLQNQIQDQLLRDACQPTRLEPDLDPDLDLSPGDSASSSDPAPPPDPVTDCRSKLEFALKLGYSEELVLLVLRKLGPGALINDMLGELVKLGTRTETEQQGGPILPQASVSSSPSSSLTCSPSSSSSLNSCRLMFSSKLAEDKGNLRPVVVDGSNVAMSHGNKEVFSCQGIQLAVDWFLDRGHTDVTVFVPAWRKEQSRPDALITDQEILRRLEKEKILVFTPSRRVQGRRVVCYDDRFIVKLAYESDGIIVSNDNYRDLANEKPEWKKFIDERLLMYSFVNDKFMPPDDPLGRHGPSLENFLRKKPVISEHRKQPCPYGKKCTYGHKCKFYHPERGSQPQRAVADELRASARISSVTSRGLLENALMVKSQSSADAETSRGNKQQNVSLPISLVDLTEDSVQMPSQAGERRGLSSSVTTGHPAPGGPPSSGHLDPGGSSRVAVTSGLSQVESLFRCESPEMIYGSLVKNYSSLSLVMSQTPECFLPADLQGLSFPSDCSSDGSASSDSFSPDLLADDSPKCHHHHPHHHHHHAAQHAYHASCASPGLGQPYPSRYSAPPGLRRQQAFSVDDAPSSLISHVSPRSFKIPAAFIPPQRQHATLSSFPNSPRQSQASFVHPQSQTSPIARNLLGSPWQDGSLPDSRVYEGSTLYSRRSYSALTQQINWEPDYQSAAQPCYDPFSNKSLSQLHAKAWHTPWSQQVHSTPSGLSTPARPQQSLPCIKAHKSQQASGGLHQDPPVFARYQDLRERVFVNLCGIFPPDLVRVVMSRNPLMTDAQELAAAILLEKSQHGS